MYSTFIDISMGIALCGVGLLCVAFAIYLIKEAFWW